MDTKNDSKRNASMKKQPLTDRERFLAVATGQTPDYVPMLTVDSDGCAMQLVPLLVECGFNSLYPFEVHGNNDLFALREQFPELVMFGWLENEVVNDGQGHRIDHEIRSKVPPLLAKGRYFPNGDHGIQPDVTFPNLCKFMTILHEVCNNPEGEFPQGIVVLSKVL